MFTARFRLGRARDRISRGDGENRRRVAPGRRHGHDALTYTRAVRTTSSLPLLALSPLLLAVLTASACGGSAAPSTTSPDGGGGGDAASGGDDGGSEASEGGSTYVPPPPVATKASFGTYIVLGDSISDRGGAGPFFYDLLHQNDDTTYPSWKGHDLATKFPNLQYVHDAVAGSVTGAYGDAYTTGAPLLTDQVKKLGTTYPGDVLVTITIGGNDLNFHAPDAVLGLDGPDKTKFTSLLQGVLDELATPARLGSGKVYILEANVYDASDGKGDWTSGGAACPKYNVPSSQDQDVFAAWNKIITDQIAAHASADYVFDIHGLFGGHGFNNATDPWYFTDCIHPNQKGHAELRREAWRMITGESIDD
jgi:lysophospholipase L1-like esterase